LESNAAEVPNRVIGDVVTEYLDISAGIKDAELENCY